MAVNLLEFKFFGTHPSVLVHTLTKFPYASITALHFGKQQMHVCERTAKYSLLLADYINSESFK